MKYARHIPLAAALALSLSAAADAAPAYRAANYKEALARAGQTGEDIAVYQRGSDWSHLGEQLLADVWNQPKFAKAVGAGTILVVVDNPEAPGSPPVSAQAPEGALPNEGAPRVSPLQRLRELTDSNRPLPADELEQIACANGLAFKRRADGCFVSNGASPAQEVLTLTLRPAHAGSVLRLDFPLDDSLPGRGPGRAGNGNFALSEVEADGLRPAAAWATQTEGAWGAWLAIDGSSGKADDSWNPAAHNHRPQTLLVALDTPAPAGAPLTVRLICKSQWSEHVPGCVSACVFAEPSVAADVRAVGRAERELADNAAFGWRDAFTPRIAFMDREGRPVASENKPRQGLTPAALAARLRDMQKVRAGRDALWARADKEAGPRQAELYLEGLLAMGDAVAFDGAYKPIHDKVRAADPQDESGCSRRLQFPPDPRAVPPLVADAYKLVDEKKYEEALARLDAELKHPGNRLLTHEHIQRIMGGKFNVYRRWPGHEDVRFDVQREIYTFDPTTYWGLGAIGYLAMHDKTPEPVALCYGWSPCHLKPGLNAWTLSLDMPKHFDHAGTYCLRILHKGGKDSVKILRVRLLDGDSVLSEAAPSAILAPNSKVEVNLAIPMWPPRKALAVRLELEADSGKTDVGGRFEVDPLLGSPGGAR